MFLRVTAEFHIHKNRARDPTLGRIPMFTKIGEEFQWKEG